MFEDHYGREQFTVHRPFTTNLIIVMRIRLNIEKLSTSSIPIEILALQQSKSNFHFKDSRLMS